MAHSDKKIIFKRSDGTIAILMPVDSCSLTFDEIIAKDVPLGCKYKIINKDEVPTDRSFRNAWTVADSDLTDGVGISTTALP
tara:strand:- start:217 stop:462 length:246 start_codon:yes stop_codon:yes gene_type:complete